MFVGPDVVDLADQSVASLASKPRMIALGFDREGYERHDAWIEAGAARDPRLEANPQDDVIQLYTSGTTGLPKGVQLTNRNYLALFEFPTDLGGLNYEWGDTVLAVMPFFHVAGVNVALVTMASGARSAILRDAAPQLILVIRSASERCQSMVAFLAPAPHSNADGKGAGSAAPISPACDR